MAGHHWGTQAAQDSCIEIVGLAITDVAAGGLLADHGVREIGRRPAGWTHVCSDLGTGCPDQDRQDLAGAAGAGDPFRRPGREPS